MSEPRGSFEDRWSYEHTGDKIMLKSGWQRLKGTDDGVPFETGSVSYTGDVVGTIQLGGTFPPGKWAKGLWVSVIRVDDGNNGTEKQPLPIYFDENDWRAAVPFGPLWLPAGNRLAVDFKLVGLTEADKFGLHDFVFKGVSIPRRQNVRIAI